MIVFQEQVFPSLEIEWSTQDVGLEIAWYHGEQRDPRNVEERKGSSGLRDLHPVSIFSIETYLWEDTVEW